MAEKLAYLLKLKGTAANIREFKRVVYKSDDISLSFHKAAFFGGDPLFEDRNEMNYRAYRTYEGPKKIITLKETPTEILYYFKSNGPAPICFLKEGFPGLIIKHASISIKRYRNSLAGEVQNAGCGVIAMRLKEMLKNYPGIEEEDLEVAGSNKMNEAEADKYLKRLSRERNKTFIRKNYKESFDKMTTPSYPYFLRKYKGKTAYVIISNWKINIEKIPEGYDLVLWNHPDSLETAQEEFNYSGLIYERLKPGIIKMSGVDPKLAFRILKACDIKVQCVAGEWINWFSDQGPILNDGAYFIVKISPVLTDHPYFISDKPPEDEPEQLPMINGFPNLHFDAVCVNPEDVPFDYKLFAFSSVKRRYMEEWKSRELAGLTYPLDMERPYPVFQLHRRPPETEVFLTGKVVLLLSHASVCDYGEKFDCRIPKFKGIDETYKTRRQHPERAYIINRDWFQAVDFGLFFREAYLEKWRSIGIGYDMTLDIDVFLKELCKIKRKYPSLIHFFTMNRNIKQELSIKMTNLFKENHE